jgi:hypothetical protein
MDANIHPSVSFHGHRDELLYGVTLADITVNQHGIAAYSEDIVNGLLAIARCACCYHNGGAGPSEYLGDSFSDSLTGSRDNGYFPREIP